MNEKQRGSSTGPNDTGGEKPPGIFSVHGVRYQVMDVARAAAFYTDHLGFRLEHQAKGAHQVRPPQAADRTALSDGKAAPETND